MKSKTYTVPFRYQRKSFVGSVTEMKLAEEKMVRVSVDIGENTPMYLFSIPALKMSYSGMIYLTNG